MAIFNSFFKFQRVCIAIACHSSTAPGHSGRGLRGIRRATPPLRGKRSWGLRDDGLAAIKKRENKQQYTGLVLNGWENLFIIYC